MTDSEKKNQKSKGTEKSAADSENLESGRRKLLKAGGFVASAALVPEKWQKPVVDSIMLPAHAQTSTVLIGAVVIRGGSLMPDTPADAMVAEPDSGVLDILIRPASAGAVPAPTPSCFGECATVSQPNSENKCAFSLTGGYGDGTLINTTGLNYSGSVTGINVSGAFTDQNFTTFIGTLTGGCVGGFTATLGGSCSPTPSPGPSPAPTPSPSAPTPSPTPIGTPSPTPVAPTPSPSSPPTPSPTVTPV